jgi:hypothetical protein
LYIILYYLYIYIYRTEDLEIEIATGHIIEYITRDYFYDLSGSTEDFLSCIPELRLNVEEALEEDGRLNGIVILFIKYIYLYMLCFK